MRVGLIVLGEHHDIRLATTRGRAWLAEYFDGRVTPVLPAALDGWVRRHDTSRRDWEVPAARGPFLVDRGDRRLVVRLIGEHPRRLLVLSEERSGADRQALEALGLTRREAEVLAWVAEGKRDAEIATILGISSRTVSHHLEHVYRKLGVETRTSAAGCARQAQAAAS
jgi:DNA-binding CsgD family transcriptional regulator